MARDQDPLGGSADPVALAQEGLRLENAYQVSGQTQFAERAAEYFRASVAALEEVKRLGGDVLTGTLLGDRFHAQLLDLLGKIAFELYESTGRSEALNEAVEMLRRAVDVAPEGPMDRAAALAELVVVLRKLFERNGDVALVREAVEAGRAAVTATPEDHQERALRLNILATALYRLAERTGDAEMLAEALALGQDGVAATPADHPRRASMLSDVSAMARQLYKFTGDTTALAEAVVAAQAARDATPADDPQRPDHLSNLGIALREAFERTGDPEMLTAAVKAGRESVEATPPGHPALVARAMNLAVSLQRDFESTGRSDRILEAVAHARAAEEAAPEDLADRGVVLGTLGNLLRTAYERTRLETALGEASRVLLAAVEATPQGHPSRYGILNDLAITAKLLAERTGIPEGYKAAYSYFEQAEAELPPDHRDRLLVLGNRAAMALAIFEFDKRPEIGETAVAVLRAVALNTPDNDPSRATRLRNLGLALQILAAEHDTNADLLKEALERFREATGSAAAPTLVRIQAGREQARLELAAGASEAALETIERVVDLIDHVAPANLVRSDRESQMALLDGLPAQAAAVALAAGRPERAVELLERTRGVLVADALALRGGESTRLRAAHPDLAQRLDSARNALAALDEISDPGALTETQVLASAASWHNSAQQRVEARAVVEDVLSRIRTLETFEDFLRPGLTELAACAQAGPIVLVTCTPERCDALIITGDATEIVRHVRLPDADHNTVSEHAVQLRNARQRAASRDLNPVEHADAEQTIMRVLAWQWDTIAEPVLTALGYRSTPSSGGQEAADGDTEWPRLWWCPVGVAAGLPLHGAGHHGDTADRPGGRRTVLDRVVSSYTPTLTALRASATNAAAGPAGQNADTHAAKALIIAVPDTPGSPLPGAAREADALNNLLPDARVLSNPTRAEVLDALPKHRIVHFACHGHADLERPRQSRLILADHDIAPLTVADLIHLEFNADLAYLSACSTSVTAPQLADEALHLTGAFHLLGYRQVIGTLWPVDDDAAADLATHVYSHLLEDGTKLDTKRAANALHHAVRALRARQPASPSLWASYIHTGV